VVGEILQLVVPGASRGLQRCDVGGGNVVDAVDDGGWLGSGAGGGRGRRHRGSELLLLGSTDGAAAWSMGGGCVGCTKGWRLRLDPLGGVGGWIPRARRQIDPGASRWRPEVQGY
jgi:hypothetical protein